MPPAPTWRRRWDSNPRALADNLISSQARYDHFDTSPYIIEILEQTVSNKNRFCVIRNCKNRINQCFYYATDRSLMQALKQIA